MMILAPISVGELLDKLTILNIKFEKITDENKLVNIIRERNILQKLSDNNIKYVPGLDTLYNQLYQINLELWDIEDNKRKHERDKNFNDEFVQLARQVYLKNDIRAKIKKEINLLTESDIIEEKSY